MRIEEGRKAVQDAPASSIAWGRLGMLFYAHSYKSEADICFARAQRLDPEEPRWIYFQAINLDKRDPAAALRQYEQALEKCGDRPPSVRLRYAELLLKENHLEEAEQQFRAVLRRDGNDARAHLGLARLAAQRGDVEESFRHLERSAQDPAGERASHYLMAELYERRGDNELAEVHQKAALQAKNIGWTDAFVDEALEFRTGLRKYLNRSSTLIHLGHHAEAADLLEKLTKVYPNSFQVWARLAKAHMRLQDWSGADVALRRALEIDPSGVEAHFLMGLFTEEKGDFQEACKWFRKAIEVEPFLADAHYHLGLSLAKLHERPGATDALRTALRCQPNLAEAHLALATELAQGGQALEAMIHAQAALQVDPKDAKGKKLLTKVLSEATFPMVP